MSLENSLGCGQRRGCDCRAHDTAVYQLDDAMDPGADGGIVGHQNDGLAPRCQVTEDAEYSRRGLAI